MSQFPQANINTKYKLYKTYCMSVYGSQLWDFSKKLCDRFYTAWRKCVRRLFRLPCNAHSVLLHLICNDMPVNLQLHVRFVEFMKSCLSSNNKIVQMCGKLALCDSKSTANSSWKHVCDLWNMEQDINDITIHEMRKANVVNESMDQLIMSGLLRDLLLYNENSDDPNIAALIQEVSTL